MHYMEFQIAMTLSLSNSFFFFFFFFFLRPFPNILFFEQFNMLHLSVSLCVLLIGHCGRRNIRVSSVKNLELTNVFP